ncbi:recombinase family protein [Streptococcus anginosus]
MLIGYARVSTVEQHTALQLDALRNAGCETIYQEKQSAVKARPELEKCLARLQPGDVLIVYKLDRLARSLKHLLFVLERLESAGAGLRSITEPVDTSTPMGKLIIQVLGAVAEFERTLIRERSIAGQVAAIRRGVTVGSRPKKITDEQAEEIKRLYAEGGHTLASLGKLYCCSHTTIRRTIHGDERDRMVVLRQYL